MRECRLLGTEESVTRIPETGNDVGVFVQFFVQRRHKDFDFRMMIMHHPDTLGSRDEREELN